MRLPSAGQMNRRVTLEGPATRTPTSGGGLAMVYPVLGTVWAMVEQFNGGWYFAGVQDKDQVATHRVTIRFRSDWRDVKTALVGSTRMKVVTARALDDRNRFVEILLNEARTDV